MALIKTDYDLSGGAVLSDEVVAPNNWRVTATTTSCPAKQRVKLIFEVEDEQGNWASVTDEKDTVISFTLIGNETKSRNILVANAANGRMRIVPKEMLEAISGTINVDSINA